MFKGRKRGVKVLTLPVLAPLRAILDASEPGRQTWLETSLGKPYSNAGFGNAFKDWCKEAGLPRCNCHGLRKTGAVRAAEAGASEYELMAMFGWEDADMARVYTRKAAQKRLAASGAAKLGYSEIIVPPTVPLSEIGSKNRRLEAGWWTRQERKLYNKYDDLHLKTPQKQPAETSGEFRESENAEGERARLLLQLGAEAQALTDSLQRLIELEEARGLGGRP
jgi:hypothetical protein